MQAYGFPWPPMLDCDKFPLDNDMCITAQSVREAAAGDTGPSNPGPARDTPPGKGESDKSPIHISL